VSKRFSGVLVAALALACVAGTSSKADAAFIAAICDDLTCTGGNDTLVTDNGAGDTIGSAGAINFTTSAFGYVLVVNTSQSKPIIGSASVPQLDLTFTATTIASGGGQIFLYAGDTDFVGAHSFNLSIGGTNSGGSGTVTGRAWGGSTNNALTFSPLLATTGPLTGAAFSALVPGSYVPTVSPYSLSIGVAINRTTAGTTTGDLNLSVPEPASMTLFGLGLLGTALSRRRRQAAK
jgi:hypothetical protein